MSQGRVRIKVQVEDRSVKDLRSALKDLETAFESLNRVKAFDNVAKEAKMATDEFVGVSDSADNVKDSIDDIDGAAVEDVSKSADDASDSLGDTAKSADQADASLENVDGDSLDDVSQQADKAGDSIEKTDREANKFSFSLKDIAKSAVVIKAVSMIFDTLKRSMDDAISRFDTLNTYPRTMQLIGYETQEVDRSTRKLVRGIDGLPTKLDDVIQTAQRLGGMTGDLDEATDTTLALNNAFLASGSGAADAARGTEQYIQMLGNGKPDMQSWRTLQETMNYALIETAESFGFTGVNAIQDFYAALRDGDISFNDFNKRLIDLNDAQGGFAELALTNAEGIATSWTNIQTAVSRGMESLIRALDEISIAITGKNIAQNLNNFKYVIDDVFGAVSGTIRALSPIIELAINGFIGLFQVLNTLQPVIKGVVTAFVAFKIINSLVGAWTLFKTAVDAARTSMILFEVASTLTGTGLSSLPSLIGALITGLTTFATSASAATGALGAFKAIITVLMGPIGWIAAGIGAIATAFFILRKESESTKKVRKNVEELTSVTSELNDRIDQTANSYEKSKAQTDGQSEALRTLMRETEELAEKEVKSAADKEILKANIEELNDSVDGLNASYDEQQGRLTATNDAMSAYLDLEEQDLALNDARERKSEIEAQHAEATKQLEVNQRELSEAQEHLDGLAWYQSKKEAKEGVDELTEANEDLTEKIGIMGEQQQRVDQDIKESAEALAQAREDANQRTITSLEQLSENQSAVVERMQERYTDLETTTTDMFSRIEEKSRISIDEMNENLIKNQQAVEQWSSNLKTLSEAGVDQGMLEQLARLGPEGAPYVQELVDATPEKLKELESNFIKGGEVAKQGMFDSIGIDEGDVIDGIPELATRTTDDLKSSIQSAELNKVIPENLKESKEDMIEAGKDVGRGAAEGIKQSSKEVGEASRGLGKDTSDAFAAELGIQSPSTVFRTHGTDIVEGVAQGIKGNKSKATTAINELADELSKTMKTSIDNMNVDSDGGFKKFLKTIEASFKQATTVVNRDTKTMERTTKSGFTALFRNAQTNFNQVPPLARRTMNSTVQAMRSASSQSQTAGRMLGLGFRNGLASTAGSIYSLASTIANNAVRRINNALKVRSPSREGFASGDFLGQGLWLGMKNQIRNVEKWADELGEAALLSSLTPKSLGMDLAFAGGASNTSGNVTTSNVDNRQYNLNAHPSGTESDEREYMERLFKEFKWYIANEGGAFN